MRLVHAFEEGPSGASNENMRKPPNISFETFLSFVLFASAVLYAIYHVMKTSAGLDSTHNQYNDFTLGWKITSSQRDSADYEWEIGKSLIFSLFPWIIFQLCLTELFLFLRPYHFLHFFLPVSQCFISVSYILFNFGITSLMVLLYQPIVFYLFSKTKRKSTIWLCIVLNLLLLEFFKNCEQHDCLDILNISEVQHFILILSVYWINLRCISFSMNDIENNDGNILDYLSYCFYLPLLFMGPFISFNDFIKSRCDYFEKCGDTRYPIFTRLKILLQKQVRFLFWLIFTDFSLHFIYVNVLALNPQLVQKFDSITLYGFGYCMGQYFHLKYVVLYGMSTAIAEFDNMSIPNTPKCIGRIHLYSDMWKYFDSGLYKFLLRYIYLPIKTRSSTYIASFMCFVFVYVWHGCLKLDIFIWALVNYLAICLEHLGKFIYKNHLKNRYALTPKWETRLGCAISAPLLMISAISNFYFFGGVEIGNIFVKRILTDSSLSTGLLLVALYCCGQISIAVKQIEKREKTQ